MTLEKNDDISPDRERRVDEGQIAAEQQMRDIGADLYLEMLQYTREELDAERKVVLRKIDWVIMPMVRCRCSIEKLYVLSEGRFASRTLFSSSTNSL